MLESLDATGVIGLADRLFPNHWTRLARIGYRVSIPGFFEVANNHKQSTSGIEAKVIVFQR